MSYDSGIYRKFTNKKNDIDINIYIVDDEEYYLNLEKVSLSKYGYNNIKIFTSGEECLLEIEKDEPDCVIIDYLIKDGMNGNEILNIINEKYPDIYVLVLSGQEDISVATKIIKDGAYEYVVKNKMTFFNLSNSLSKIKEIKKTDKKLRNKKFLYILLICIVWVIGIYGISYLFSTFKI